MTQRLHVDFGGELVTPASTLFGKVDAPHIVAMSPAKELG